MSNELKSISVEEVVKNHEVLVADFATTKDPISPAGVKDLRLLESAVSRQHTAMASTLKYPGPVENAARKGMSNYGMPIGDNEIQSSTDMAGEIQDWAQVDPD
jgi:hypothetical protein